MRVCVDTNILIDILKDEYRDYQEKFYLALTKNEHLLIPSVVYAELLPQFDGDTNFLDSFLSDHKIKVMPIDIDSATEAAIRWMKYIKRKTKKKCQHCGKTLAFKERLLSDFYIGGFAIVKCDAILTRDRGIYKKYFSELYGYDNCLM